MTPNDLEQFKSCIDDRFKIHEQILAGRFDRLEEISKDHHSTLYGNGTDGLKIRVDRIETAHGTLNKVWLVATAGVITVATWLGVNQ